MKSRTVRTHLIDNPQDEKLWNPVDWRRWRLNEARKAELTNWPKHEWAAVPQLNSLQIPLPSLINELQMVDQQIPTNGIGIHNHGHAIINMEQLLDNYPGIKVNASNDEIRKLPAPHVNIGIPRPTPPNSENVRTATFVDSVPSIVEVSKTPQIKLRYTDEPKDEIEENFAASPGPRDTYLKQDVRIDTNEHIHNRIDSREKMRPTESRNHPQSNDSQMGFEKYSNGREVADRLSHFSESDWKGSPPSSLSRDTLMTPCHNVVHQVHNDLTASTHTETIVKRKQDSGYQQEHIMTLHNPLHLSTVSRASVSFAEGHDWTTQIVLPLEHPGMHTETLSSGDLFTKTGQTAKHVEHSIIGLLAFALVAFIVCQMAQQYRRRSRGAGGQGKNTSCFLRLRRWIGPFSKRRHFNCSLPSSATLYPPQLPGRPVRVETPGVAPTDVIGMTREGAVRGSTVVSMGVASGAKGDMDHGALTVEMRRRLGLAYNPLPPLSVYAGVQSSSSDYPGSSASRQSSYSGGGNSVDNRRQLGEGLVSRQLRSKSLAPSVFLVDARGPYAAGHSTSPFWRTYQPSSFTTSSSAPISSSTPSSSSSSSSASDCDFKMRYANSRDVKIQQRMEMASGFSTQKRGPESVKWNSGVERDVTHNDEKDEMIKQKPRLRDVVRETFNIDALTSNLNEKPSFISDTGTGSGSSFSKTGSGAESKHPLSTSPPEFPPIRPAVKPRTRKGTVKRLCSDQHVEDCSEKLKVQKAIANPSTVAFQKSLGILNDTLLSSGINSETMPDDASASEAKGQTSDLSSNGLTICSDKADCYSSVLPRNKVNSNKGSISDASLISVQPQHSSIHKLPIGVSTVAALLRSVRHSDVNIVDMTGISAAFQTNELTGTYEQDKGGGGVNFPLAVKSRDQSEEKDSDSSLTNVSSLRASFTTSS